MRPPSALALLCSVSVIRGAFPRAGLADRPAIPVFEPLAGVRDESAHSCAFDPVAEAAGSPLHKLPAPANIHEILQTHQEELRSLREDSKDLTDLLTEIDGRLEHQRWYQTHFRKHTRQDIDNLTSSSEKFELLKYFNAQIPVVKEMRLAELGLVEAPLTAHTSPLTKLARLMSSKPSKGSETPEQHKSHRPFLHLMSSKNSRTAVSVSAEKPKAHHGLFRIMTTRDPKMSETDERPKPSHKLGRMLSTQSPQGSGGGYKLLPAKQPGRVDSSYAWKAVTGEMIVNGLRRVLKQDDRIFDAPIDTTTVYEPPLFQHAGLKTIDILFKNGYADPALIRSLFHDHQLVDKLTQYFYHRLFYYVDLSLFKDGPLFLSDHWYWPLMHDCFAALGEREKMMVNTSVILARLKGRYERAPGYYRESAKWQDLMSKMRWIWAKYEHMEQSMKPLYSLRYGKAPWIDRMVFQEEVNMLVDVLMMEAGAEGPDADRQKLDGVVVDTLHLLERYGPGTIQAAATHTDEFDRRFHLITLASRLTDLNRQASSYYDFQPELYLHHSSSLESHRAAFAHLLHQFIETLSTFRSALASARCHYDDSSPWLKYQLKISLAESKAGLWLDDLKDKCDTFLAQ